MLEGTMRHFRMQQRTFKDAQGCFQRQRILRCYQRLCSSWFNPPGCERWEGLEWSSWTSWWACPATKCISMFGRKKCKLCLYLEDGDVTVKENAKVCFGCSMIKSLTPDWLNLQCFGNIPLLKPTSWSHRHSSWDPQGLCRGFLKKANFVVFWQKLFNCLLGTLWQVWRSASWRSQRSTSSPGWRQF